MEYRHIPVMLSEVMRYLNPCEGQYFIDCTLGGGGYAMEIARRVGKNGKVLAIDLDEMAIENFKFKILNLKLDNIILAKDDFRNLFKIVENSFENKNIKFDGIVFDLGLSSAQLADRERGFSFQFDAPLNMAFGRNTENSKQKTEYIVNNFSQEELIRIIREYGEERFAGRIAREIEHFRKLKPVKTTGQLVEIIGRAVPASYKNKRIHFATRTFQALRIATNQELENLEEALPRAVELLRPGGRIAAVSYHSLEDRIVKNFFKKESKDCLCPPEFPICQCGHKAKLKILTAKVIKPMESEVMNNPSARSAKLRAAIKI
jgi:16S rRNA (cytosine1402-N4)-methyltransferase